MKKHGGKPFTQDYQPTHDRAACGRKGKAVSPWRLGNVRRLAPDDKRKG